MKRTLLWYCRPPTPRERQRAHINRAQRTAHTTHPSRLELSVPAAMNGWGLRDALLAHEATGGVVAPLLDSLPHQMRRG